MPTVLRVEGFRFSFFSNERNEPAHIHVTTAAGIAKFWLEPVSLASSDGFNLPTLNKLHGIVRENQALFLEAWNEYFSR
jgi:hypothetical protein